MMMRKIENFKIIYFLSDAHFGAPIGVSEETRREKLSALGKQIAEPGNHLFILGDLFDFWFEWRRVIPKRHFKVLRILGDMADKGLKMYYLAGNHDFRLGGFLEQEIGIETFKAHCDFEAEGRKFHIFHGDGVQKSDAGYRFLKKVFRNRINQRLFRWVHPDLGIAVADWSSLRSRDSQLLKNPLEAENDYIKYAEVKFSEGFDFVIMGHTHRPLLKELKDGVYLNSGNWYRDFSYGVYQDGELKLEYYPGMNE